MYNFQRIKYHSRKITSLDATHGQKGRKYISLSHRCLGSETLTSFFKLRFNLKYWAKPWWSYLWLAVLLAWGCQGEKMNLMLYLWYVIIYLFDYFVNYLSIELLILLHDFPVHYSWLNLRWLHHCCSVGSRFCISSDEDIKGASVAIFHWSGETWKIILRACC